jgi:KDO2-lipid IV(A) lauroyltransferase
LFLCAADRRGRGAGLRLNVPDPFVRFWQFSGPMGQLIEAFLYKCLRAIARVLPYRAAGGLGAFLATLVYCVGFRRGVTLRNLELAYPEKGRKEIRGIARGAYRNYGRALLDLMWTSAQSAEAVREKVVYVNREVFQKAFDRKKGVILFSAHYGSWELGALTARFMAGMPLGAIVQTQRNRIIDRIVNQDRTRFGSYTIPMEVSVPEIVRVLREGKVVAILGDQSAAKESMPVNFFGRPVAAHRGAAAFSVRVGSPVVTVFMCRNPDGTYTSRMEEVDCSDFRGTTEERIDELTRRLNRILEERIRQRPDHWLWMHKRWKHTSYYQDLEQKGGAPEARGGA